MNHGKSAANRRTSAINLRAFPAQRELIDRACAAAHKNLTDFILEAACREAEHVLCGRRYFVLDEKSFKAFETALDVPLSDNKAVQKLLAGKAQWED
jgi:uncharacterized protein (DUF1778 family)